MSKLAIEILNDYPLATETARDWFVKRMIESFEQDNAPEEFKNHMLSRGVPDITLAIMLDQSPRNFFDVLDDNKIFVEIRLSDRPEGGFYYNINSTKDDVIYNERIPCERAAVEKAFELLN
jgi:hypothetical protein